MKSQLSKYVHVNKSALCFSAYACISQDASTWREKRACYELTKVSKEVLPNFDVYLLCSCAYRALPRHQQSTHRGTFLLQQSCLCRQHRPDKRT
eukprot:450205-Pelagomonas_calceolata.AAC.2